MIHYLDEKKNATIAYENSVSTFNGKSNGYEKVKPEFSQPKNTVKSEDEYKWFKVPVNVGNEVFVFPSHEGNLTDDLIFRRSMYFDQNANMYPDRKQYIYSTLPYPMYVMYPNNIVAPITTHVELATRFYGKFDNPDARSGHGVYIVEYISLKSITKMSAGLARIMDYYINGKLVGNENEYIVPAIKEVLDSNDYTYKYIRIITFVPEYLIRIHNVVFVPNVGLTVGTASVMENYAHPNSKEALYATKNVVSEAKNYIQIEIVDNNTTHDYFTKIGKEIHKIEPERNPNKQEGIGIVKFLNSTKVSQNFVALQDCRDLGIYNTLKECECDGNLGKTIENKARELELENRKLDHEENKLLHEENLLRMETDKEELKFNHYKEKIRIDTELMKLKHTFEVEENEMSKIERKDKFVLEVMKHLIEKERMEKEYVNSLSRERIENYKLKNAEIQERLENYRLASAATKERIERYKLELEKYGLEVVKKELDYKQDLLDYKQDELDYEYDKLEYDREEIEYERNNRSRRLLLSVAEFATKGINLLGKYL